MRKGSNRLFLPGNRFLIPFLAFLSAFAPISTDMYLPALPSMAIEMDAGNELMTFSISSFMLVFAISMLFWGPLSDRFGRRPALVAGSLCYMAASIAIALTDSIWQLLFWRCMQAIGSGAASAMSLAIVRDVLRGGMMEKLISIMQAATVLAPITAPIIGGWLLLLVSWRGIFWCLAFCGLLALAGSFALKETGPEAGGNSLLQTFSRMGLVLRNRTFLRPLLIFSAMSMPFMSYLGVSTFIYQDGFGVSAQMYSMFFALNAGVSLLGPLSHMYVFRHFARNRLISAYLFLMCFFGGALLALGYSGPWIFCALFMPIMFCGSAMRPPATMLMMESIEGDNGIVASLINCGGLFFGSFSMFLASLDFWPTPVMAVGCIAMAVSGICFAIWILAGKNARD